MTINSHTGDTQSTASLFRQQRYYRNLIKEAGGRLTYNRSTGEYQVWTRKGLISNGEYPWSTPRGPVLAGRQLRLLLSYC